MDMIERLRAHAFRAAVWGLAVAAAGCGSAAGTSPTGPSPEFSAGMVVVEPAGAIVGTAVSFENRLAIDPSGSALTFAWDFGDGGTATGEATSHVYETAGEFYATVTVTGGDGGSAAVTVVVTVRSLTARWSGDLDAVPGAASPGGRARVSIRQDGLHLSGTYQDDSLEGSLAGTISLTGTVSFTVTGPDMAPLTFTGTAGPNVGTLVGSANGRDVVDRPWTLARD
jgi:PKD repeat protein